MTKNSPNNSDQELAAFVAEISSIKPKDQLKETLVDGDKGQISFDGNKVEFLADEALSPKRSRGPSTLDDYNLSDKNIFKEGLIVFGQNFTTFLRVNLTTTLIFLILTFGLLFWKKSIIPDLRAALVDPLGDGSLLLMIALCFWIFFSYLRAAYLTVCSNYFGDNERRSPIFYGFGKIFSFMVLEVMQIFMIIIGAMMIFLAPFYGTRYFLSAPIMIEDDEDVVGSMIRSAQVVQLWILASVRCAFFITFSSVLIIASSYLIITSLVSDKLIAYSAIFFLFSFFLLPIHSCFRFTLYKKLHTLVKNHLIDEVSTKQKISFLVSRLALFLVLFAVICGLGVVAVQSQRLMESHSLGIFSALSDFISQTGSYSTYSYN